MKHHVSTWSLDHFILLHFGYIMRTGGGGLKIPTLVRTYIMDGPYWCFGVKITYFAL
jgi:hypothetical protein